MQTITSYIKEATDEFNPSFDTHKKAYNNLLKWYDKCIKHMNRYEVLDLLKTAVANFETEDFSEIR